MNYVNDGKGFLFLSVFYVGKNRRFNAYRGWECTHNAHEPILYDGLFYAANENALLILLFDYI